MTARLQCDGVWKSYPRWSAGGRTLRGMLSRRMPALVRGERRWALRDVSLTVGPGECVGVIGQNGAGKSTLLRLGAGLGRPDRGRVARAPNTAAVLSLGESFDLTLTGRENAMTAAAVAGLRRAEVLAVLPRVLEFAELEAFADAPVRTYSEGMKLRLAFGVVAQLQPELLLLDEVLSVGDMRFQAKCMTRIREMREAGAGVLFASHALEDIEEECERAIWLEGGRVRAAGESVAVVEAYREAMRSATLDRTPPPAEGDSGGLELRRNRLGSQELTIDRVALLGEDGAAVEEVRLGSALTVALSITNHAAPVNDPVVAVAVRRAEDGVVCYDCNTLSAGLAVGRVAEGIEVALELVRVDLAPGEYTLDVGVYEGNWAYAYDYHHAVYELRVTGPNAGLGVARPEHRWRVGRRVASESR